MTTRSAIEVPGTSFRLIEVDEVESTNLTLADAWRAGEAFGLVVRAGYQSEGRGRRDRQWHAPPDSGILMSLLLEPPSEPDLVHLLATAVGLGTVAACRALGAPVGLKWPNDVVLQTSSGQPSKLAGILAETVPEATTPGAVVVGVGLNLRPVADRDAVLGRSIAVLDQLIEQRVDVSEFALAILTQIDMRLLSITSGRVEEIREEALAVSTLVGRHVIVDLDREQVAGIAADIDDHGRLIVTTPRGQRALSVGDVVHTSIE